MGQFVHHVEIDVFLAMMEQDTATVVTLAIKSTQLLTNALLVLPALAKMECSTITQLESAKAALPHV